MTSTNPRARALSAILGVAILASSLVGSRSAKADEPQSASDATDARSARPSKGSQGLLIGGTTLAVFGPLSIIGGGLLTFVGVVSRGGSQCSQVPCDGTTSSSGGTLLLVGGISLLALGVASTVAAGVLLHLWVHPPAAATASAAPRLPEWSAERPVLPSAPWVFPVLATTF